MSRSRNFSRPYFKTQGRTTESISGSDIPAEFRAPPRATTPKADLRRDAEQAVREFLAKRPAPQKPVPIADVKAPWEDDD